MKNFFENNFPQHFLVKNCIELTMNLLNKMTIKFFIFLKILSFDDFSQRKTFNTVTIFRIRLILTSYSVSIILHKKKYIIKLRT